MGSLQELFQPVSNLLSEFMTLLPVGELLATFFIIVCLILLLTKDLSLTENIQSETEADLTVEGRISRPLSRSIPNPRPSPLAAAASARRGETQSVDRSSRTLKGVKRELVGPDCSLPNSKSLQGLTDCGVEGGGPMKNRQRWNVESTADQQSTEYRSNLLNHPLTPNYSKLSSKRYLQINSSNSNLEPYETADCNTISVGNCHANIENTKPNWSENANSITPSWFKDLMNKKTMASSTRHSSTSDLISGQLEPEDDRPEADVGVDNEMIDGVSTTVGIVGEQQEQHVGVIKDSIYQVHQDLEENQGRTSRASCGTSSHQSVDSSQHERILLLEQDNDGFRRINESLIDQIAQLREELHQKKIQKIETKETALPENNFCAVGRQLSNSSEDSFVDAEDEFTFTHTPLISAVNHSNNSARQPEDATDGPASIAQVIQNGETLLAEISGGEDDHHDDDSVARERSEGENIVSAKAIRASLCQSQMSTTREDGEEKITFQLICIGDSGVGKTSFIRHICSSDFPDMFHATVGVDFAMKSLMVEDRKLMLQIWDTAGQERYRCLTRQYLRKADAIFIIYDVTSETSFKNVRHWMTSVEAHVTETPLLCLIGNKRDLVEDSNSGRVITRKHGTDLAAEYSARFYECSAKSGEGVFKAVDDMTCLLLERYDAVCGTTVTSSFRLHHHPRIRLNANRHFGKNSNCCKH